MASMKSVSLLLATAVAVLVPGRALAQDYLQCQADLMLTDCTAVTGPWNHGTLHFGASCQVCSGGGSDIKCTPGEKATPSTLSIETTTGTAVSGSFAQVTTCAFGVPLYKFSGTLAKGEYNLLVTTSPLPKTVILTFTVGTGVPGTDGGGTTTGDGGGTTGDGGGTTGDGGGTTGDGGGGGGGSGDEGCGCRVPAGDPSPAPVLVLLLLVVVARLRSRRR
jgi:MYXO-CTERM domain-containing protein